MYTSHDVWGVPGSGCAQQRQPRLVAALHRHLAQLVVTREMLSRDKTVTGKLEELGLDTELGALLLYLDDETAELFELPEWWARRGAKLLKALGG